MARYKGKSRRQDTYIESEKDQLQELRAIVRRQQKMISQLRRELQKREDVSEDYSALVSEVQTALNPPKKKKKPAKRPCPDCKAQLKKVIIGSFELNLCGECGYRNRVKA